MTNIQCRFCGSYSYYEEPHEIHGAGLYCTECGRFIKWKGKGNQKNKRNKNSDYMKKWREQGTLTCHWCGIREDETRAHFELDHIIPLEDGGKDVFENTRPLCAACKLNEQNEALLDYLERRRDTWPVTLTCWRRRLI